MLRSFCLRLGSGALAAAITSSAHAVIIAGPNGTAAGNVTQGSLNAHTSGNSLPTFPYWNNVISVSDSSGVYLGASGAYGWVLTAAHVTQLTTGVSTITVNGTNYIVRDNQQVGIQDLRLYRIGGETADPALPALPDITISASTPSIGSGFINFGRGLRVEGTANSALDSDISQAPGSNPIYFEWNLAGGAMRWGSNQVETIPLWAGGPGHTSTFGGNTVMFVSDFDDPLPGNYLTTTESQGAVTDSGGPLFVVNGGNWELAGAAITVASFTSQPDGLTGFNDLTAFADLATYRAAILAMTIPEPSALWLAGMAAAGFLRRRRNPFES